ncbi:MAG: sulfotransferase domain-containing protein, partial [Prochlorococcus marinus]
MNIANTFWVTGTPRTGSMWTANIVREILKSNGFNIEPKEQYQSDTQFIDLFKSKAINDENPLNKYVFKVHTLLNTNIPKSKYIINIRNPYEICASFYKFMKCSFDQALEVADQHLSVINHYSNINKVDLIFIRYENISLDPLSVINALSDFIAIELKLDQLELIKDQYSKKEIKSLIKKNDIKLMNKIENNDKIINEEIVLLSKKNYR